MQRLSIAAAACFLLVAGCRKAEEKKAQEPYSIPVVVEHAGPEAGRKPYYYGLIEEYRSILAEDPKNLAAAIGLGNAYFESGGWREAIVQYEQVLNMDPRNADVRTDMGTSYRNLGMPERALDEYRISLKHEPGHLNARYNMGIVYAYDLQNYRLAVQVWEELLRLAPNYPSGPYIRTCLVTFRKSLKKEHNP